MWRPMNVSVWSLLLTVCWLSCLLQHISDANETEEGNETEEANFNTNGYATETYTTVVASEVTTTSTNFNTNGYATETYTTVDDLEDFFDPKNCYMSKNEGVGSIFNRYKRWYYDSEEKICKSFHYRGKGGNANNFRKFEECSLMCNSRCYQPIPSSHTTMCDGGGFNWAYNQGRGECLPFRNATNECYSSDYSYNKFSTKRECERDCKYYGVDVPPSPNVCLPMNTRNSICNKEFIVCGRVSSISHDIYSEYLVHRLLVEVDEVKKGHDKLSVHFVNNTDGSLSRLVEIKKILTEGRNCYEIQTGTKYMFMGDVLYSNALLDDGSYVQEYRQSVEDKVNFFINATCPS